MYFIAIAIICLLLRHRQAAAEAFTYFRFCFERKEAEKAILDVRTVSLERREAVKREERTVKINIRKFTSLEELRRFSLALAQESFLFPHHHRAMMFRKAITWRLVILIDLVYVTADQSAGFSFFDQLAKYFNVDRGESERFFN